MHLIFTCADNQITTRNNRGYAIHIRELIDALTRQQVTVTQFIAGDIQPKIERKADSRGILKSVLKNSFLKPQAYHFRDRRKFLQSEKFAEQIEKKVAQLPDAIYERYEGTSTSGLNLARKFNIPLILEINAPFWQDAHYYNQYRTRFAEKIDLKMLGQADRIVVVTEIIEQYLIEMGVSPSKIRVISNGVKVEAFAEPKMNLPASLFSRLENKTVIGYVGSFSKWHRLDYLLEAARRLRNPSLHFLLVGNGADRARIQHLVKQIQLENKFTFTREIPYSQIPAYLKLFDIAVLPNTEAYCSPIKIFEYMAAGKPVVVPDLITLRNFITPGQTGILFKENSISEFTAALKGLIENHALRLVIGSNAFHLARKKFTWEKTATQIIEMINEIS